MPLVVARASNQANSQHGFTECLLWDPSNGKALRLLKGNVRRVTCLCFSRDGKTLYSTGWDQAVRRWDVHSGEEIRGPEYDLDQSSIARSADGKLVATGGTDGPVTLWAAATGRRLRVLRGHEGGWLLELALSPDGRRLASCGPERTVRVWDVASGKVERSLDYGPVSKQQGQIESVAFSPDGRLLAACDSERHVVHLWDAASGKKLRELAQPSPRALAFAPDGKTVAVGGWDRSVVLWTVATGRKSRSIVAGGTDQNTNAIAYSPNGRLLATGHHTDPVHLWDAATGELVRAIKTGHKLTWCLSFSPDGAWLATGGIDRTAALWEVATGRELHRLSGHESEVLNLAFGPDGRTLATGGFDRTSLLWTLKPKFSPLPAGGLASLWDDLRGEDAARAYRAVWAVAEHPEAVPFLKERLGRPRPAQGKAWVRRLLDDLGSDEFARREAASGELAKLGAMVEAEARAKREATADPEVRRRLDALLKGLRRELSAEQLRRVRAASALRLIGGREAAEVLRGLDER